MISTVRQSAKDEGSKEVSSPIWVQEVMSLYREFDSSKSEVINTIYDENIVFTDPIHELQGLKAVEDYFSHIGKGLNYCDFEFVSTCAVDECAWLRWVMTFSHPRLSGGKPIAVNGASELRRADKIYSHIDFYDMGAMVYDNVPVLGNMTRFLRNRLAPK